MVCFFTQGNGKKPLFRAVTCEPCTVLGSPMLRAVCHRPGSRGVVRALKKRGADGFAETPDLPDGLAQTLKDAGFSAFDGKTLMALMLPDILRHLQKLHRLDASVPIVIYSDAADERCRRAVYDAATFSRQVCLICPDGGVQTLADDVLENTGQAVALCAPNGRRIAVWCGVRGEAADFVINLCAARAEGAINSIILTAPGGSRMDMALAEAALCERLTRDAVGAAGLKLTLFS